MTIEFRIKERIMQKENVVKVIIGRVKPDVKISCHAELVSASSTHAISQRQQQRQAWKTLKSVQGDTPIFNNNGFTLIELLVVVLIIGILASVALPQYKFAVIKSRLAALKPMMKSLKDAQEMYYIANGDYAYDLINQELDIDHKCTVNLSDGTVIKCDPYFNIDILAAAEYRDSTNYIYAVYCPGYVDNWITCSSHRYFEYRVWLDHSAKPDQTECIGRTDFGTKFCKTAQQ